MSSVGLFYYKFRVVICNGLLYGTLLLLVSAHTDVLHIESESER